MAEIFKTPDGTPVATGLVLPNESELRLMAGVAEMPEKLYLDEKQIERSLVINGEQRYKQDRKKRAKRMRNQSQLGKCNASSNTSAAENAREEQGMPDIALSDCHLYSRINGGGDNGSALITSMEEMQRVGCSPMEVQVGGMTRVLPNDVYNRRNFDREVLKIADQEAARFKGMEYYKAPTESFEKFCACIASAIARICAAMSC
jgi:hypothetical protein